MDAATLKKHNRWQWRIIISLMIGYALFYFVRKNLSMAIPAMEAELGITKVQLGVFMTLNGIIYGASRFFNGYLADRFSRRKIMSLGLLLSALVNFAIAFSPKMNGVMHLLDTEGKATMGLVYLIGSLWLVNGYVQGMGVPPCMSLLAHWVRPKELPTKQAIWNTSHSIGAGLVVVLCGFLLRHFGYSAWNLCFIVPAAIALMGVPIIFFGVKDDPSEVGLPPVEKMDEDASSKEKPLSKGLQKKIMVKMVFKNPIVWTLAFANFCMNVIRGTILDWGGTFLVQDKGFEIAIAGTVIGSCELVGGILGMLVSGWATDKFFGHRAHRTCLVCMVLTTICFALFWGSSGMASTIIFLILSSFFIYGPQALYGTCASMQCTKYAAATGNGILGILGYMSTLVSGMWFGSVASSALGWNRVYIYVIGFGILGSIITALIWNVPADGYAKVEKIIKEAGE
jgi:OPA family glycerol-3-phosphate transporter-like MFS transporter/OPA family sugar phosphate sensor protein UhpC-like MFS transporter